MKAVQIVNPSEMKVVELEKPTVGAGEVLVRIKYVGFCGSDLNTFLGRNPMVKLPVIPGHEVGAVIEEVGPNVPAGFEKGMNVYIFCLGVNHIRSTYPFRQFQFLVIQW